METLAELVRRSGGLPLEEAIGWTIRLAKRLEELHRLGVAHGGLSADCVLVAGPSAAGQGFFADVRQSAPRFEYHSPERHQGRGISQADDTWAVAVTLYLAATGVLPWPGDNAPEVKRKLSNAAAAPLAVYDRDDEELQRVFDTFLARNVSQRVVRVSALREALEKWHDKPGLRELYSLDDLEEGPGDDTESGDEDDEDVKTVMRDFSEVRKQLKQLGATPSGPGQARPAGAAAPAQTRGSAPPAQAPQAAGTGAANPTHGPSASHVPPSDASSARGPRVAQAPSPFKSTAVGLGLAEAAAAARAASGRGGSGATIPMPVMGGPASGPARPTPAPSPPPPQRSGQGALPPAAPVRSGAPSAQGPVTLRGPGIAQMPLAAARPAPAPAPAPAQRPPHPSAPQVINVPATRGNAVAPGLPSMVEDDSQDGVHTLLMDQEGQMPHDVADAINRARAQAGLAPASGLSGAPGPVAARSGTPPPFGQSAAPQPQPPQPTPPGVPAQPGFGPSTNTPSGLQAPSGLGPNTPSGLQAQPPFGPHTPSGLQAPPGLGPNTPSGLQAQPPFGPHTPSGSQAQPPFGPHTPSGLQAPPAFGPPAQAGPAPFAPGMVPGPQGMQSQAASPGGPMGEPQGFQPGMIPGAINTPRAPATAPNPLKRWLVVLLIVFVIVVGVAVFAVLRYTGVLAF